MRQEQSIAREDAPPALSGEEGTVFPASFGQRRLWFVHQLAPTYAAYNMPFAWRVKGPLNLGALEQSLNEIVRRHQALRTTFTTREGQLLQVIAAPRFIPLSITDLEALPYSDREDQAHARLAEEAHHPFDLAQGPLLRLLLLRLAPEEHVLMISMHHIISDGWSMKLLFRELNALYEAFSRKEPSPLPALPLQYADHAVWQHEMMREGRLQRQLSYWRKQLANLSVPELPTDHPRPHTPSYSGASHTFTLPPNITKHIDTLKREERSTLFILLLATWKALLYRYTGQADVAVGTPSAGRSNRGVADLIGFFVNTLVLRTQVDTDATFRDLLRRVRATALDAYEHQDLPFEKVVEELQPNRDLGRTPLFQVMFSLQEASGDRFTLPGLSLDPIRIVRDTVKFDLSIFMRHAGEGLTGTIRYNKDLFEQGTIGRLGDHYGRLLQAAVATPDLPLSSFSLLSPTERQRLVQAGNPTAPSYAFNRGIHHLFEDQANRSPQATALIEGELHLSYEQLHQRAGRLAEDLRALGAAPGRRVGLCLERSAEMVIAMLATLITGAAYVPLDTQQPTARLRFMIDDADLVFLLSHDKAPLTLSGEHPALYQLDGYGQLLQALTPTPTRTATVPPDEGEAPDEGETPAYLMYTSGSTGTPKGVLVPHRAIARLVLHTNYLHLTPHDRLAHLSNTAFDAATFEVWGALLNGAQLVVLSHETALSPHRLADAFRHHGLTTVFLTTSLFNVMAHQLPAAFAPLKQVLFGGEVASVPAVRAVLEAGPPARLLNVYGPTENTTFTTWHEIESVPEGARWIPIGRPISHTSVYVMDEAGSLVPEGVVGELYVGGSGLALAYHRRPELTGTRFVERAVGQPGSEPKRLYRTGDKVRWGAGGVLEYVGRGDGQVKMRGFRIELGEIEAVLSEHEAVQSCAVGVMREAAGRATGLVGYVVTHQDVDPQALLAHLRERLPAYMVPARLDYIKALPLTANGKIDRKALELSADETLLLSKTTTPPRNRTEARLVHLWEKLLKQHPIGIEDDFFDLGGHSLLAVELFAAIHHHFGKDLPLSTIFRAPTIEALTRVLHEEDTASFWSTLVPIQPKGSRPPLFCVHGISSGVMRWKAVASAMGPDQPVYGVQGKGLDGCAIPDRSVREMVTSYVDEMTMMYPHGPYLLAGFCFGGLVAYEVAQQLRARGKEVALLALVETAQPSLRKQFDPPSRAQRVSKNLQKIQEGGASSLTAWMKTAVAYRVRRAKHHLNRQLAGGYLSLNRPIPKRLRNTYVLATNTALIRSYEPQPYPGAIVLIRSSQNKIDQSDLGWEVLAQGGISPFDLDGSHFLLDDPFAADLAHLLRTCIATALSDAG